MQSEHLTKRCPGVRRRSTGVQEPFVQTCRLAFKAGHNRAETFVVQVVLDSRSVKTLRQGGHIYDLPLERVKLAGSEFRCGIIVQEIMEKLRMVDDC